MDMMKCGCCSLNKNCTLLLLQKTFLVAYFPACHIRAGGALAAPLAGSGKMELGCAQLDVTLSALHGTKTGVTEEGSLWCTSAHAQVGTAFRTTMVPSPKKDSTTDRTQYG